MFRKKYLILIALIIMSGILMTSYPMVHASETEKNDLILENATFYACPDEVNEYYEQLMYVPDDVLSGSTENLLEYFLKSDYMAYQRMREGLLSSPDLVRFVDYTEHPAFKELINRKDFPESLEAYIKELLTDSKFTEDVADTFEKLLEQPAIKSLIFDKDNVARDYPNLQSIYTQNQVSTAAIGDWLWKINDIDYYSAGTINTADGSPVVVGVPERELDANEINIFNSTNISGAMRVHEPTALYNCHSYAWYYTSIYNPYWIDNAGVETLLNDNACSDGFDPALAQINDIILYYSLQEKILHSGVVSSIDSSGNIMVKSKWGQGGVYIHNIASVPLEYQVVYGSGYVACGAFRYHNYESIYTGNHYHQGKMHYFEYASSCAVCGVSDVVTWEKVICNGPPCVTLDRFR